MSLDTTLIFLVAVAVIAANQGVLRVATLRRNPWVFWGLQLLNLVIACWVLLFGLPGFEHTIGRWVGVVMGLLLIFRIVQNNMLRQRYLRREVEEEREEERKERAREVALQILDKERKEREARATGSGTGDEAVSDEEDVSDLPADDAPAAEPGDDEATA